MKVCVQDGIPVELRKQVAPGLRYDTSGSQWVFSVLTSRARDGSPIWSPTMWDSGRENLPHEETLRDLILERSQIFQIVDVTGAPWVEIDFPADVERAAHEVLPQLLPLSGVGGMNAVTPRAPRHFTQQPAAPDADPARNSSS